MSLVDNVLLLTNFVNRWDFDCSVRFFPKYCYHNSSSEAYEVHDIIWRIAHDPRVLVHVKQRPRQSTADSIRGLLPFCPGGRGTRMLAFVFLINPRRRMGISYSTQYSKFVCKPIKSSTCRNASTCHSTGVWRYCSFLCGMRAPSTPVQVLLPVAAFLPYVYIECASPSRHTIHGYSSTWYSTFKVYGSMGSL